MKSWQIMIGGYVAQIMGGIVYVVRVFDASSSAVHSAAFAVLGVPWVVTLLLFAGVLTLPAFAMMLLGRWPRVAALWSFGAAGLMGLAVAGGDNLLSYGVIYPPVVAIAGVVVLMEHRSEREDPAPGASAP